MSKKTNVIKMPGKVRTKRSKGKKEIEIVATDLTWTTLTCLGGMTQTGCLDAAILLTRMQIHDRIRLGARSWAVYPEDRVGVIGMGGSRGLRVLGITHRKMVKNAHAQKGETLHVVKLPWEGCGRDLAEFCGIRHLHSALEEEKETKGKKRKQA